MVGLVLFTLVASVIFCGVYKRLAQRWQIYDIPNERSAHDLPTPRGGGAGIYLGLLAGCLAAAYVLGSWNMEFWALLGFSGALVILGMVDDVHNLAVGVRFLLYAIICAAAVYLLLGDLSWPAQLLAVVYVLWILNLYNFMDGIDAIAGVETLSVGVAAAGLSLYYAGDSQFALFCLFLAAASAGFLHFNWPPAQLFMGDAGSVTIGFLLAMLSLLGDFHNALPLACWLVLLAVFICDASLTLVWRIATRQRFTEAHSLHLYQRLSRHWGQHLRVVWAVLAVNVLWLWPLAFAAMVFESLRWPIVIIAYIPLAWALAKSKNLH